ncbi:MAG: NosD domain-containing protein [Candidatus Lokiarchaeota archaeon]
MRRKLFEVQICFFLILLFLSITLVPNVLFGSKRNLQPRDNTKKVITLASQSGSENIFINNNWSTIVNRYNWCNGSGTKNDPYVIKDIYFTKGTSITIKNTLEHFKICNCTFFNCNRGIRLENVSNGVILNNNFTNTYGFALKLDNCYNLSFSSNLIYNSKSSPIVIDSSIYVNISRNFIDIEEANDGICFEDVNYSHIEYNIVNFRSGAYKIYLDHSNHNVILNNSLITIGGNGLRLYSSSFNLISNNLFKDDDLAIDLSMRSNNNTVIYNEIKTEGQGMYFYYSNLNNVSFNYIKAHGGIYLYYSNKSLILNNTIYYNKWGYIDECHCVNNTILGNIYISIRIPTPIDLSFLYDLLIVISIVALAATGAVVYYLRIRKRKLEKEIK